MTFTLTPDQFDACRAKLAAIQGVTIQSVAGDAGTVEAQGVVANFAYFAPTLTVTVVDYGGHPSFFVNHAIKGWFKAQ